LEWDWLPRANALKMAIKTNKMEMGEDTNQIRGDKDLPLGIGWNGAHFPGGKKEGGFIYPKAHTLGEPQ